MYIYIYMNASLLFPFLHLNAATNECHSLPYKYHRCVCMPMWPCLLICDVLNIAHMIAYFSLCKRFPQIIVQNMARPLSGTPPRRVVSPLSAWLAFVAKFAWTMKNLKMWAYRTECDVNLIMTAQVSHQSFRPITTLCWAHGSKAGNTKIQKLTSRLTVRPDVFAHICSLHNADIHSRSDSFVEGSSTLFLDTYKDMYMCCLHV